MQGPRTNGDVEKSVSSMDGSQTAARQKTPEELEKSFLVEWDGDNDALDPRNFSTARKWMYVVIVAMGSLLV